MRRLKKNNEKHKSLTATGKPYASNPDIYEILKRNVQLSPYERSLFYITTNGRYNSFGKYGEGICIEKDVALE